MDWHEGPQIALACGLYLANIMEMYEGPHIALTIALIGGLYLTIIMDGHEAPQTALI
jgi:hypothetical protein